jgi:hypothetical protein
MMRKLPPDIEELEAQVAAEPDSEDVRGDLLLEYCGHPELQGDPRRICHIRWYVQRFPRSATCRSPMVAVDPDASTDGFHAVEEEWNRLLADYPSDPEIAIGAALFIVARDRSRATHLLRALLDVEPGQANVWYQMGRIALDPNERLDFFKKARSLGETNPNLPVWIANLAAEVGDRATAEAVAQELFHLVAAARSTYGDKLDWSEKGHDLWARATAIDPDRAAASQLVSAIGTHAYHKHSAHTVMGLIALQCGDLLVAARHLRESGEVVGNPRLSSYGPAMSLAGELCERGRWDDVAAYLEACTAFWSDDRLLRWREQVARKERPDFSDK